MNEKGGEVHEEKRWGDRTQAAPDSYWSADGDAAGINPNNSRAQEQNIIDADKRES